MQVQYVGEQDIDIGTDRVRTKHFVRLPRHPTTNAGGNLAGAVAELDAGASASDGA
jgi:hypothetical protein